MPEPLEPKTIRQLDLETTELSNQIRDRLDMIVGYDYTRLPHRVAYSILENMKRLAWFDGEVFYYGGKRGTREFLTKDKFSELEHLMPEPIWRGGVYFYPITSTVKYNDMVFEAVSFDLGYIEFFIDMLSGNLGIDYTDDGPELWRRFGSITDQIENIESFYGVRKPIEGVTEICMDMMKVSREIASMKVERAVSIGNTLYNGIYQEPFREWMIPKVMLPDISIDLKKAKGFFDLVCPDPASQHNLKLATVYPYFKRSNEKFFVLKGCGGNGKSRYIRHFEALLGNKFGVVELAGMVGNGFDRSNAIGRLQGKQVIQAPETNLDNPKFVSELKRIATGDELVARSIGGNSYSFKPKGALFIDTNFAVDLGNSDAIERRLVGISFVNRRLRMSEMEPYYRWVTTLEGACSLFVLAYSYYSEECGATFSWNSVYVGDDYGDEDVAKEAALELYHSYEELGDDAYIKTDNLSSNQWERKKFYEEFGLTTTTKRVDGKTKRVVCIKDYDLFLEQCDNRGYLDEV